MPEDLPDRWGQDHITTFIENVRQNQFASFANLTQQFSLLKKVDDVWVRARDNMDNPQEIVPSFLLFRAHSCYLHAISLGMSGAIPETNVVLRTCLEYALYSLHMTRNQNLVEVWLRRDESDANERQVRNTFQFGTVIRTLDDESHDLAHRVKRAYKLTIGWGGHPNVTGMIAGMTTETEGTTRRYLNFYLTADPRKISGAMKFIGRSGLLSLMIFKRVFPQRFDLLGITDSLRSIERSMRW